MTVQTLKLQGERYVLMREKDFKTLSRKAAAGSRTTNGTRSTRLSAQDLGDIAESRRRKARGPARPYSELRKKLGLA